MQNNRSKPIEPLATSATPMAQIIKDHIKQNGPITVDQFMNMALYNNEYGYYNPNRTCAQMGGTGADFITSPEISQLFGECIAFWFVNFLDNQKVDTIHIMELGPGKGTLMADIMRTFQKIAPDLFLKINVHLFEASKTLSTFQSKALDKYKDTIKITWYEDISLLKTMNFPKDDILLFIANEFFDALPCKQFVNSYGLLEERLVGLDEHDNLQFYPENCSVLLEKSPLALSVMDDLAVLATQIPTAGLIIDYGYYTPPPSITLDPEIDEPRDTLQAMQNHQYCDIFEEIGNADLTYHVDFYALKDILKTHSIKTYGPTFQGVFLQELGINQRADVLAKHAKPTQSIDILLGAVRLTSTIHMGNLFKVLGFTSANLTTPMIGFSTCLD